MDWIDRPLSLSMSIAFRHCLDTVWRWWSGYAAKKDKPRDAILNFTSQLEFLSKHGKRLEKLIDELNRSVRGLVNTNKRNTAKAKLWRKKDLAFALECTLIQILTIEYQIYRIDAANYDMETFEAMKRASTTMERIRGEYWPHVTEKEMKENLRDSKLFIEQQNKIQTPGSDLDVLDDDALEDVLNAIQQEQLDEKMLETNDMPAKKLLGTTDNSLEQQWLRHS